MHAKIEKYTKNRTKCLKKIVNTLLHYTIKKYNYLFTCSTIYFFLNSL